MESKSLSPSDSLTSGHFICLSLHAKAHILFIRIAGDALMAYPCIPKQEKRTGERKDRGEEKKETNDSRERLNSI